MTGQVYKLSLKFTTIATIMEMVFTFNRNTVVHKWSFLHHMCKSLIADQCTFPVFIDIISHALVVVDNWKHWSCLCRTRFGKRRTVGTYRKLHCFLTRPGRP